MIISALRKYGEKMHVAQFYNVITQFDKLEGLSEDSWAWTCFRELLDKHSGVGVIDLESAVRVRNIAVKRYPNDMELI